MSKTYSCEEIAERYGVKTLTVWAWIREKKLPAIKVSKSYRVREARISRSLRSERKTVNGKFAKL